jgi:hypothetical protein
MAHHTVPFEDRRHFLFEEIRSRHGRASLLRYKRRADRAKRQKSASSVSQTPSLHLVSFRIPERAESIGFVRSDPFSAITLKVLPVASIGIGFIRFSSQTNTQDLSSLTRRDVVSPDDHALNRTAKVNRRCGGRDNTITVLFKVLESDKAPLTTIC